MRAPRALRGDVLKTAVSEVRFLSRAAAFPVDGWRRSPMATRVEPGRPPVLLVHGYLGHPAMLRPLAERLVAEGWPRAERLSYPSAFISLEGLIDHIAAAAKPLTVDGPIDVVGHSLGAVGVRAWLKCGGGARFVRRFVSLGGPHAGTSMYRAVPGPMRAAFDPRGAWVARLNEGPEPVPTTVIRAAYDHQVFPPERAAILGVTEIVLRGYGHNGLLWAPEAHDAVVEALGYPAPR